ncbi:MAG: TraR/DksA C4-type zinc finger protein [Bryobacteraceae bacterium]|nr:TraR/DksA C4-type zinc finger protein [Bryobacteraceae bacterium]
MKRPAAPAGERRCADCGQEIPEEHLAENPGADRCVVCEFALEAA